MPGDPADRPGRLANLSGALKDASAAQLMALGWTKPG